MFVELHIIQNFAPSNLNRDDTNSPKDCVFGGVRRARISSQCIKRAIRNAPVFAATTAVNPGVRTKRMAEMLQKMLVDAGKNTEDAALVALTLAESYSGKMDKGKTSVLIYFSPEEIQFLIDHILADWEAILASCGMVKDKPKKSSQIDALVKDLIKATKNRTSAPDIALFGRMLADKPELSLDAASQVAHALSTHRVDMEMDFFTAVDDLQPQEEAGAGMMGFTGFNSATFYRYARVDWGQLIRNLNGDGDLALKTLEGFLRASVAAIPTGKQNSFAAQNPPSFLLAVVREDGMSWSLANAFEKPVRAWNNSGLVAPSVKKLDTYWNGLCKMYGTAGIRSVAGLALEDFELQYLTENMASGIDDWLTAILTDLSQEISA